MSSITTTAIVTKYALTSGPKFYIGKLDPEISTTMFTVRKPGEMSQYFHGSEWHRAKRDAVDDVLNRYASKKRSLMRAISKLDAKRDKALKAIEGMEIE